MINELSEQEKQEVLFDWIRNLDEFALDELIEEYIYPDESKTKNQVNKGVEPTARCGCKNPDPTEIKICIECDGYVE